MNLYSIRIEVVGVFPDLRCSGIMETYELYRTNMEEARKTANVLSWILGEKATILGHVQKTQDPVVTQLPKEDDDKRKPYQVTQW